MTTPRLLSLLAAIGLCALPLAAAPGLASPGHDHGGAKKANARPFGPWDAGPKRDVVRQDERGKARPAFPTLGDVGKVPGDGPPPPPIRKDPDVPESALLGVNNIAGPGLSSNPLWLAYLAYSNAFSKIDGPRCSHLPTCSRFAAQAVSKHGLVGILMGLDRMIQPPESSAVRSLPQVEGWGIVRHLDPLSNYEFWKEERFTGFPLATNESAPELLSLEQNAKRLGDAVVDVGLQGPTDDVLAQAR